MRTTNSGILHSASNLADYIECEHLIARELCNLETPLKATQADEQALLLQQKGDEHESRYLEQLKAQCCAVEEVPRRVSLEEAVKQTHEAMRRGAQVIYQAAFHEPPFMGYADFLVRTARPSNLGAWSYEVADTKLAMTPKPRHLVQISLYSRMLASVQGAAPLYAHLVVGNGTTESFALAHYRHYTERLIQRYLAFVANPGGTAPERCGHCGLCEWRELCQEQWRQEDHLNQVANIRRQDIIKLRAAGIGTLEALATQGDPTKKPVPRLGSQHTLWRQAVLQHAKRETGTDDVELKPDQPDQSGKPMGFRRLPAPDEGDLFFDMEGDPLEDGGLEYLFGVSYHDDGKLVFKPFWGHDRAQEKKAFEAFIDFVMQRIRAFPRLHIYHYADYERRALQRLMAEHGSREAEVDSLLREQRLVDLYAVVKHAIQTSEPRYSIKNLETFYMKGERSAQVKNAGASIVFYERWKTSGDAKLLEQIERYNEEDCRSTWLLRQWLIGLRPADMPWYERALPAAPEEKPEEAQRAAEARARREKLDAALLTGVPVDSAQWTAEHRVRVLLHHLLDFYRREDKPMWWRRFERQEMTPAELMDDADSLAGMTLDTKASPVKDKKSWLVHYRYPEQEFRLDEGEDCEDTALLLSAGRLHALDRDARKATLRVGPSVMTRWGGQPPQILSIAAVNNVFKGALVGAMYRYIECHAEEHGAAPRRYRALSEFLHRNPPRITGHTAGMPLVPGGSDLLAEAMRLVLAMDETYLFIQGPPGAGKTYTGARLILALIRAGKRVGVSANSHKAIINLLAEVERAAAEQAFCFKGAKKSGNGEDGRLNGKLIEDIGDDSIYGTEYRLVGGTAWAFANEKADQAFDYLFVDEAGQVSLANLLAMGVSARNLVLLGDQMQLAQPLQGTHPGESGQSALDYLLGGRATIEPDRGVFLGRTWRMHPRVCEFISEAVYDGRLTSHPANANQCLLLSEAAHPALRESGIGFVPVDHRDCAQSSQEEADVIRAIVDSLVRQHYRDRDGRRRPMKPENILVVAPYNDQVRTLQATLPQGIRIGTVDKFQGMEAEVAIVSMTTSSAEDMPRNMEFLYDKHRLNVAISRARILALVVASPRLLDTRCSTPEQMALVNVLCWASQLQ